MTEFNPYAPPEAEAGFGRVDADPESYWIETDTLFVKNNAVLPDVCLRTGAVDGILTRQHHRFLFHPKWLNWIFIVAITLSISLKIPNVSPITILAYLILRLALRKQISFGYCLSKKAQKRQVLATYIHLAITIGSVIFYVRFASVYNLHFLVLLVPIVLSGIITRRIARSISLQNISKGIAQFSKVHPEALRQLTRWRTARLPAS